MIPDDCGYVVLFWARPKGVQGYREAVERARKAVESVPGYLGQQVVDDGDGSTSVIYWRDQQSMEAWKNHPVHLESKARAREWYHDFRVLHCPVRKSPSPSDGDQK